NHVDGSDIPWQVVEAHDSCTNFERARELVPPDITAALAEGAKLLPLSQNKFAIVDADDYERLNKYKWCLSKAPHTNYALTRLKARPVKPKRAKRKAILMHRFILNAPRHLVVDHINHNGLDNRKSNLRLCTRAQNCYNSRSFNNKSSRYKGVSWDKQRKRFVAYIRCNGKCYNLGRFKSETEAARAYDKKAKELFGEYAYLNFP
ncbi:MAG: AP2 domain-containing protein, partial [Planctomycetota bacterium]